MIWDFIQNQILGMKWLSSLIGAILDRLPPRLSAPIRGGIQFFFYDMIKITILLCSLIFLISYIQSYFPPERSKRILGRFHALWANLTAALLGTQSHLSAPVLLFRFLSDLQVLVSPSAQPFLF